MQGFVALVITVCDRPALPPRLGSVFQIPFDCITTADAALGADAVLPQPRPPPPSAPAGSGAPARLVSAARSTPVWQIRGGGGSSGVLRRISPLGDVWSPDGTVLAIGGTCPPPTWLASPCNVEFSGTRFVGATLLAQHAAQRRSGVSRGREESHACWCSLWWRVHRGGRPGAAGVCMLLTGGGQSRQIMLWTSAG